MTVTARNLVPAKLVEIVQTTQYIVPSNASATIIDKFTATNISGAIATISVNLVTGSDIAGNQNLITKTKSLNISEVYTFPELVGQIMPSTSFISTIASAPSAINMRVSGREIT
jgi:hypothetical protein